MASDPTTFISQPGPEQRRVSSTLVGCSMWLRGPFLQRNCFSLVLFFRFSPFLPWMVVHPVTDDTVSTVLWWQWPVHCSHLI